MSLKIPGPIAGLQRAREAVRNRWAKEAARTAVSWSPDVIDVRSTDIDKAVQFAQDVKAIITLVEKFDHSDVSPTYQISYGATIMDQLERLAATHFREPTGSTPLVVERR